MAGERSGVEPIAQHYYLRGKTANLQTARILIDLSENLWWSVDSTQESNPEPYAQSTH